MLRTANAMSDNDERCLNLLQKLVDLLDHVKKLDYQLPDDGDKLKRATVVIVKGCMVCASQLSSHKLSRFLKAFVNKEILSSLEKEIDDLRGDLTLTAVVEGAVVVHPLIRPRYPENAVGLHERKAEVIKFLQSGDKPRIAVVIYGFGGMGKTTLAEAVVANIDREPYHYTRVNFNIDSHKNDIKKMQEQILNDLFPNYTKRTKTEVRDPWHGRDVLTEAFQEEGNKPIFLFIDNALRKQDLVDLLPTDMKGLPEGSRILLTRDLGATDMFIQDEVGLERQPYPLQPLPDQEAKEFLLKGFAGQQLDNIEEKDVDTLVNTCKGVPLVLKIVQGHFKKQGYRADKCSDILRALKSGEQNKEDDLGKTLTDFVYDQLEEYSQQAFLDICSFLYNMDPSWVEYIVGAEALTSLKEAAFVQVQRSDDEETLIVHDIIRERGRKKAESTRIMKVESIIDAANEQRLKDIRAVWLVDEPKCEIAEQHLKVMTKLRVLALRGYVTDSSRCEVTFTDLRCLSVDGGIPCLPVNLERLPKLAVYFGPLFKKGFDMYKLPEGLRVLIAMPQSEFSESTYDCKALQCLPESFGELKP